MMMFGGEMLVRRVVRSLLDSGVVGDIIVVTGHRAAEVADAVRGGMGGWGVGVGGLRRW